MTTDLPPEAFTQKTLQAAFDWLQTQPEALRSAVHTPQRLVSLYKKSQRSQGSEPSGVSKKFISDLKTLADPLAESLPPLEPAPFEASPLEASQSSPPLQSFDSSPPSPQASAAHSPPSPQPSAPASLPESDSQPNSDSLLALDSVIRQRVMEVQSRFNLSSSDEALRLLVSLGYEKFSKFEI